MKTDLSPPGDTPFTVMAIEEDVLRRPTISERMRHLFRRMGLSGLRLTTNKIGVMYSAQSFAKLAEIEPMIRRRCPGCDRERPHTYWPDGHYRCMHCLHQRESLRIEPCLSHGPILHVTWSDGDFRCWKCWSDIARPRLADLLEKRAVRTLMPVGIARAG